MLGVMVAMVGYVAGIPRAMAFRVKNGRWPEA
jgi:hypothetical protein